MKEHLEKYKILYIELLILILGLTIHTKIVNYVILLAMILFTFIFLKESLLFLLICTPARPLIIDICPEFKPLGDIIILTALIKLFVIKMREKSIKDLFTLNIFEAAFILFCILGSISALITGVSLKAIVFQNRAFLLFFLVFYIVKRLKISSLDVHRFLWVSFSMGLVLSVHGLIEKISLRTVLVPDSWKGSPMSPANFPRIYSMMWEPNILGLYLVIIFILTMYLLFRTSGKMRFVLFAGQIIFATVFVFTFSRGSYLAAIVFAFIYLLFNYKHIHYKRAVKYLVSILIPTVILVYSVSSLTNYIESIQDHNRVSKDHSQTDESDINRVKNTFTSQELQDSLNYGRLSYIKKGLEIFRDHPIIGTGFATFGDSATKSFSSPIYKQYNIGWNFYSDGQYIQIVVQTGGLGVLIFGIYLLSMIIYSWKYRKGYAFSPLIVFFITSAVLCGFYYNIWEADTYTLYFFAVLAFVFSGKYKYVGDLNARV